MHVDILDNGDVQIVEMQLVHAEHLFTQVNVFVHGREVLVHAGDEVGIDLRGHFVLVEAILERTVVSARVGVELELLGLSAERCGCRVAELRIRCIHGGIGRFAQLAVIGHHERDVAAVRNGMSLTLRIDGILEREIRIIEEREDVLGLHGHVLRASEQLLLGIVQDVTALMEHDVKRAAI